MSVYYTWQLGEYLLVNDVAQSKDDSVVRALQSLFQIDHDHVVIHDVVDITLRLVNRVHRGILPSYSPPRFSTGEYNTRMASMS